MYKAAVVGGWWWWASSIDDMRAPPHSCTRRAADSLKDKTICICPICRARVERRHVSAGSRSRSSRGWEGGRGDAQQAPTAASHLSAVELAVGAFNCLSLCTHSFSTMSTICIAHSTNV